MKKDAQRRSLQDMVSCAWSNRESEGSCNVCQTRDDPKVLCVSLPCIGFRVCKVCAAELISKLESAANAQAERHPPQTTSDVNMQETNKQPEGGADVRSSAWLECDDCHCKGSDVEETTCPYAKEIHNEVVPATLCKKCYHERCMYI